MYFGFSLGQPLDKRKREVHQLAYIIPIQVVEGWSNVLLTFGSLPARVHRDSNPDYDCWLVRAKYDVNDSYLCEQKSRIG